MKILMIAPQPFFQPRGTPFSVLHRLKAMSLLGYHIDLVTYHIGENVPIENVSIHRTVSVPFISNITIGPSYKKIICDFFLFWKAFFMLYRGGYDVLHTHEEAGFMGILFKKIFGIPYIYDMHSSLPQQLTNFKRGNIKMVISIFQWLEKKTLINADGIITICCDLQFAVEKIDRGLRPVLIENVADNSVIFESESERDKDAVLKLRRRYNIPEKAPVVLYTGTFEKYQGIDMLLNAAAICLKRHDNLIFILVGGNEEQVSKFKKIAKELRIVQNIIFTGSVHPRQIPAFYEISTMIASPRIEGTNSPLKIYSYLRSGKPIIATNCYTHTQVLNSKISLLTNPMPEEFANGIIVLHRDSKLRSLLAKAANEYAEKKYRYEDYLAKTAEVYKRVDRNWGRGGNFL